MEKKTQKNERNEMEERNGMKKVTEREEKVRENVGGMAGEGRR